MKKIRLENTQNNSNKFYEMEEKSNGLFTAKWGRIGSSIYPAQKDYHISEWDDILNKKLKKGYIQMNPTATQATKKVAAKKVVKKRPAKRAVKSNSVEGKFMRLKRHINELYQTPASDGRVNSKLDANSDSDLGFCTGVLEEIRSGINPSKDMLIKANELWRKYN